ncbi:uncharacterized protein [Haliotis asinina]|uniref:uncharacterized protein n=1 Tax=Haliotis asinina TaxID=109174 RepID=UPI003531ECA4
MGIWKVKNCLSTRIKATYILIADETSMISTAIFEKVEYICRKVKNSQAYSTPGPSRVTCCQKHPKEGYDFIEDSGSYIQEDLSCCREIPHARPTDDSISTFPDAFDSDGSDYDDEALQEINRPESACQSPTESQEHQGDDHDESTLQEPTDVEMNTGTLQMHATSDAGAPKELTETEVIKVISALSPKKQYKVTIRSFIRDLMQKKWDTQMPLNAFLMN